MRPLVSVVVPVYNAGPWVRDCLLSVLAQTISSIEVLVVLDAPTDGSAEVVADVAATDPRVTVLENAVNVGLATSRNVGLARGTADYVAFVDADDLVDPRMYEEMVGLAQDADADVVSCGFHRVAEGGNVLTTHPAPFPAGVVLEHDDMVSALAQGHATRALWFSWRHVFRRSLLETNGLRFDEGLRTGEDMPFNLEVLLHARRWVGTDMPFYSYRTSPAGLTMSRWVPHLVPDLQRAYTAKARLVRLWELGEEGMEDLQVYTIANLLPRVVANAEGSASPDLSELQLSEALSLPMFRESLVAVRPWDARLPRGVQVMAGLARWGMVRSLLRFSRSRH